MTTIVLPTCLDEEVISAAPVSTTGYGNDAAYSDPIEASGLAYIALQASCALTSTGIASPSVSFEGSLDGTVWFGLSYTYMAASSDPSTRMVISQPLLPKLVRAVFNVAGEDVSGTVTVRVYAPRQLL